VRAIAVADGLPPSYLAFFSSFGSAAHFSATAIPSILPAAANSFLLASVAAIPYCHSTAACRWALEDPNSSDNEGTVGRQSQLGAFVHRVAATFDGMSFSQIARLLRQLQSLREVLEAAEETAAENDILI